MDLRKLVSPYVYCCGSVNKNRIEETIYTNIDRLVLPYVEKLLRGRLTEKQRKKPEVLSALFGK